MRSAIEPGTKSKTIVGTVHRRLRSAGGQVPEQNPIELKVHFAQDDETGVWYIADSDIPGLRVEADSADALMRKVTEVAPDLIELNVEEILAAQGAEGQYGAERPKLNIRPVFDSPMPVARSA
jgi:hypothetical protein